MFGIITNIALSSIYILFCVFSHPELKLGDSSDVYLFVMPLFHLYGGFAVCFFSLAIGAKVVLMAKFDPQRWLEGIQKHKVI